ncbi:hypothetical protein FDK13_07485 [Dyadobacter frigoris]|uniref:Uncharacterized protein n=1 Tax=Dyadobacter frigoris TaxID=2576211 RepID=A0A4U6D936_9BACT|nr:hypothetical protein FDK13_07485 [Dyadobacter frigoris]
MERIQTIKSTLSENASNGLEQIREAQTVFNDFKKLKELLKYPKYKLAHVEIVKTHLLSISGEEYMDWTMLDLWLHTYNEWLIKITRDKNTGFTNNDFNDLMNLVYVPPGALYWSLDKKKTLPLIREAGFERYLFSSDK